jgi:hypothetical protein
MRQFLFFAFQLSVIAWLRSVSSTPRNTSRIDRLCTEFMFGLLVALPLLG